MTKPKKSYGTGLAAYQKAIVGLLTPVVTYAVTKWLLDFPPEAIAAIVGVLTGVVVYVTPNKFIEKSYG